MSRRRASSRWVSHFDVMKEGSDDGLLGCFMCLSVWMGPPIMVRKLITKEHGHLVNQSGGAQGAGGGAARDG